MLAFCILKTKIFWDMVIITKKKEKQYASLYRMLKWWWVCDKMMITRFYGGLEGVST